jgi:hypothetical protein
VKNESLRKVYTSSEGNNFSKLKILKIGNLSDNREMRVKKGKIRN